MLYERWQEVARERGSEWALYEAATGRCWTFAQMADAKLPVPSMTGPVVYAHGHAAEFIFMVLAAWKREAVLCPVEEAESPQVRLPLPPECRHIKTTSATTGAGRQILFSEEQLACDADQIVATMGLRREWPNLGFISLAHSYGFSNLVLPLLLHGIPLVLGGSPLPEAARGVLASGTDWTLPAVPALWRVWHDAQVLGSNIRLAISAGAALPLDLERRIFEENRLKIHNFLGASECGGIAYDASGEPRAEASCVGGAMCGVCWEVDREGCLRVLSASAGLTYWPEPSADLAPGCFQTRDLVELRGKHLYWRGRLADRINVAGRKVSPESIEEVLRRHPAVRDCLVLGLPDETRDEQIVACVACQTPVSAGELKAFLQQHLPAWQVPRQWVFDDSLRADQRGKLSRSAWREKLLRH